MYYILWFNQYRRGPETCPQAKTSKNERAIFFSFFVRRVRATSMTQRRVENTRVHFWTFSPVSVKAYEAIFLSAHVFQNNYSCANGGDFGNFSGKTPATATMKCKCPRTGSDNVRVCGWFSRRLSDQKPPLGLRFLYV